ncbi:hypothetical protein GGR55DRAFT_695956 [Xylaria sp. FL0064]|nr:hypothetical protein GGR55DRAFT_695956 [Xylaria sp. FL0064]
MHAEWLTQLTPEETSRYPEWAMKRYFLASGLPDRAKTTTVVGFPFEQHSSYTSGQTRTAADDISGLHHETGHGPQTQTVFRHAGNEAAALKAANEGREAERTKLYNDYLKTLKRKKDPKIFSPVGTYLVNCEEIEGQWPEQADDLGLTIRKTEESGIYEAIFEFGILEGVMITSTDQMSVDQYCSEMDRETDDEYESSEEEMQSGSKGKRAVASPKGRGRGWPPKKFKSTLSQLRKYNLKLRCAETGEGEIFYKAEDGTIAFQIHVLV